MSAVAIRRALGRIGEPYVLFPLIALVLLGVIWGMTGNLIQVERAAAHRAAVAATRDFADTYEAQVVRALREIDQALKVVQFAHDRGGRGAELLADLREKGLLPPGLLFVVAIADREGKVVASTRTPDMQDVSREAFFSDQRAGSGITISEPRRSPIDKEWKLDFTRSLRAPDGSFGGLVMVSVAAAYFVSGYESSKMGQQGVLVLLGRDGVIRAGRSGERTFMGAATDYREVVATDPDAEARVVDSPWDRVPRYTLGRELFEYPVAVVTGIARDEQIGPAYHRAGEYVWRALAGSAALVLLLGLLGRSSWQLARTRQDANRALNLRNRAIESSVNAVLIASRGRGEYPIEYVNPSFERITGFPASQALGRDLESMIGGDPIARMEVARALRETREGHVVVKSARRDGSEFWCEFSLAPVREESGEITHFVGVMNDVTEAKEYEAQLAHQAQYDTLTGLANRNLLQDRLTQAIASARREGGTLATVLLDLDHFKVVNDGMGHNRGDELLRHVAHCLRSTVRESDTVARLGGDEFVVVLHTRHDTAHSIEADVTALVTKLLHSVSQPFQVEGRTITSHCSIGVALYPQDGEDAQTMLRNADAAMYRAKDLGRRRFQFFTADMHERVQRRIELESSLRQALDRSEFELFYQPQVSLGNGRVVGVEALLRWRHPEKGYIGPAQFVPFAEETGLIVPIGEWVLRRACRQNKAWQDAGMKPIPIAVNMSARQLEQPDVADVVRRALADSGLDPKYLELEITESLSMAQPDQSVPLMKRLKETGVSLSIDDFGTGFSNLSYLCRFPVDRLKIDLSFVRDITTDPGSLAISEAIITMSHSLNLQVVAEGVETEGQLRLLGARRCDQIQGFFFSPPLVAPDFADLMREDRRLPQHQTGFTHAAPAITM